MVRQRLLQVVAQVPADAKPVGRDLHKLPLGPQAFKEKDNFELEKDHGIDAGATYGGVAVGHQLPDKREIERRLEAALEVVLRDELFERDVVW